MRDCWDDRHIIRDLNAGMGEFLVRVSSETDLLVGESCVSREPLKTGDRKGLLLAMGICEDDADFIGSIGFLGAGPFLVLSREAGDDVLEDSELEAFTLAGTADFSGVAVWEAVVLDPSLLGF